MTFFGLEVISLIVAADIGGTKSREVLFYIPKITFCNDVEALGHGLCLLPPEDFCSLTPGNLAVPVPGEFSNKAILAPCTGLGEAFILDGEVYPSEGAHCEFGPRTEEEVHLWRFLHRKFGHVSYERLLSGTRTFEYLRLFMGR